MTDPEFEGVFNHLVEPIKEPPKVCYRCGKLARSDKMTLQSKDYAQTWCLGCFGKVLELASDFFNEEQSPRSNR